MRLKYENGRNMKTVEIGKWHKIELPAGPAIENSLLLLLTVLYPFHFRLLTPAGGVNTSYGDAIVAIVVVLFALSLVGRLVVFPYAVWAGVFFGAATLSLVVNGLFFPIETFNWSNGIAELVKFAGAVGWMVAVFALLFNNPRSRIRMFASMLIVVGVILGLWTTYLTTTGEVRPAGPFRRPNIYGGYLLLCTMLAWYLTNDLREIGWTRTARLILWLCVPLLSVFVLVTGSRGAGFGLVVGTIFMINWTSLHKRPINSLLNGTVIGALAISGLWLIYRTRSAIIYRFAGLILDRSDRNLDRRLENWGGGVEAFLSNPLFGIGYGQYHDFRPMVTSLTTADIHQTYLGILVETGLVGFIIFVGLSYSIITDGIKIMREKHPTVKYAFVIVVATAAQGVAADVDSFRSLWIALGILAVLVYHHRSESNPQTKIRQ